MTQTQPTNDKGTAKQHKKKPANFVNHDDRKTSTDEGNGKKEKIKKGKYKKAHHLPCGLYAEYNGGGGNVAASCERGLAATPCPSSWGCGWKSRGSYSYLNSPALC
jgi:hypothetical protein